MASGRNRNTTGDYELEYRQNMRFHEEIMQQDARITTNYFADVGLLQGKKPKSVLCRNQVDVETDLLGIGANNLVHPKTGGPVEPMMHVFHPVSVAERPVVYLPAPLRIDPNQRPFRV